MPSYSISHYVDNYEGICLFVANLLKALLAHAEIYSIVALFQLHISVYLIVNQVNLEVH